MSEPTNLSVIGEGKRNELELTADEKTINQRIIYLRKARRLTQREFASKLNVSDKLVYKWEQEGKVPGLDDVVNISKTFNVTLDYLVNGKRTAADVQALTPLPPPPPPFNDPVQALVKKIEEIINKNKLQKFKEQLFPCSSEDAIYELIEFVRKTNLEEWGHREFDGGSVARYYKDQYREDRRSSRNLIDERYWGQVVFQDHYLRQPKFDAKLFQFGVFIITSFNGLSKQTSASSRVLENYGISFSIDVNALLALDNFEVYSKLTSLGIPLHRDYFKTPQEADPSDLFTGLNFQEGFYKLINTESRYDNNLRRTITHRDYNRYPFTYEDLVGLTDVRFFSLLKKDELDMLLQKINLKNSRIWEVIVALIDGGAMKKKLVKVTRAQMAFDYYSVVREEDDVLGTLMLYEFAKMKIDK